MQNAKRYMPMGIEHFYRDYASRHGMDFEKLKYDYETDDFQKLIDAAAAAIDAAAAEDAKRAAAEKALEDFANAEVARKVDFLVAHCQRMFAAAINQRSNCVKFRLFSVLQAACERIALYDTDDFSPANKLANLVARAEIWLFDEPDPERFHRAIVYAFQRSGFTDFSGLAEALRVEEEARAIMALRRSTFTRRRVL